jgi:hypothetical protein
VDAFLRVVALYGQGLQPRVVPSLKVPTGQSSVEGGEKSVELVSMVVLVVPLLVPLLIIW